MWAASTVGGQLDTFRGVAAGRTTGRSLSVRTEPTAPQAKADMTPGDPPENYRTDAAPLSRMESDPTTMVLSEAQDRGLNR
jgi:hypothetical protein